MQPWEKQYYHVVCANGAATIESAMRSGHGTRVYVWVQRATATEPGIIWCNYNGENPNPAECEFLPPPAFAGRWECVPYSALAHTLANMLRRHPVIAQNVV